jgi:hypothetical protein
MFSVTAALAGQLGSVRIISPHLAAVFALAFDGGVLRFILPLASRRDFSLQSEPIVKCHQSTHPFGEPNPDIRFREKSTISTHHHLPNVVST